jgi:glutathione S-transferase
MYFFQNDYSSINLKLTMVLKLYGLYISPWVRLVAAILHEKQVAFELVSVDFTNKEHKSPEYLEKHPFGQIPYIVCDSLNFCVCLRNSIHLALGLD